LTDFVILFGSAVELQMRRGFLFGWSMAASREIFKRWLKYLRASSWERMTLKPQ
jgi:hypothetical protein